MKKLFTLAVIAFAVVSNALAQTERNRILNCAVHDVHYVEPKPQEAPTNKTENVVNQVVKGLFSLASGENTETADRPEYSQTALQGLTSAMGAARRVNVFQTQYVPGEPVADGIAYYIDGTISSIKSSTRQRVWVDKDKRSHTVTEHTANIIGEVVIKSIETDQIIWSLTINSSAWNYSWYNSIDEAVGQAISCMRYNVCHKLNESYPLYANIVEGERFTEKKAKEVYIDLGSHNGVFKGMHFFVYSVKEIAGRQAKKKIGQLKVTECSAEDISLCKVQSGGKDIKEAMDAGEELLIMSKD